MSRVGCGWFLSEIVAPAAKSSMPNSFELGRFECLVTEVHKMAVANCSKLLLRNCGSKQRFRWDIRVRIRKVLLHIGGAIRIFVLGYCTG